MARRSRSSRASNSAAPIAPPSPHIRRTLPFFDVLDEEKIERLEDQVDWILQDVGIAFRDDPEAIELWKAEGANVEGDIVRAPSDWIRSLCAKAPREFTQLARNPERSVTIGGANQVFAPIYGAPFVRDLEGGRRYGDIEAFSRSCEAHIHASEPSPWGICHLRALRHPGQQASFGHADGSYDAVRQTAPWGDNGDESRSG